MHERSQAPFSVWADFRSGVSNSFLSRDTEALCFSSEDKVFGKNKKKKNKFPCVSDHHQQSKQSSIPTVSVSSFMLHLVVKLAELPVLRCKKIILLIAETIFKQAT